MAHQQHGKGECDCPKLRMSAWVGPASTGWQEPILLVMPLSPRAALWLREVARHAGLRPGVELYAEGVMAHLDGHSAVTLAVGQQRAGPVRVSPVWAEAARTYGDVVLMLGTMTVPEDMDTEAYPERHGDELVTGLVPVAGAAGEWRCPAMASFSSLPLAGWRAPTGHEQSQEEQ